MKYWLLNVFSLSLSIDLDWGRVMKVENIALFEEENDTVTRQDPSLLDMASYQEQIQKLAPRLYDLLTALVVPPIRYGRSRTGEKNGSKVLHIMSMILKQRSQRAAVLPTLMTFQVISKSTSRQVQMSDIFGPCQRLKKVSLIGN